MEATKEKLLEVFEVMPDQLQQDLLAYAQKLLEQNSSQKPVKGRVAGSAKGKYFMSDDFDEPLLKKHVSEAHGSAKGKIWMSEDFDEPLEDFKEYM
jgi:hypothetical protein